MASETANSAPPAGGDSSSFTLQIISPSIGVPRGQLSFPELPTSTTVSQLKAKIREVLDARPSDHTQRLIHRGRLLARDNETMVEVFGAETLRSSEPRTLHLVLRDLSDAHPAQGQTPPASSQNATPSHAPSETQPGAGAHGYPQPPNPPHMYHNHHNPFQPYPQARGVPWQNAPFTMPGVNIQGGFNPQQMGLQRQWTAAMNAQIAANAQMEHQRLQELINQNQRERAAMGLNGAQDNQTLNQRGTPGNHTPTRTASPLGDRPRWMNTLLEPDGTRTVTREGVGPNGGHWRLTINESVTTPQGLVRNQAQRAGSPFSAAEMQNLWRPHIGGPQPRSVPSGPDQTATRVWSDALRRNASSSSLVNLNGQSNQPIPPGVTTPLLPSRAGSATGTPDPVRMAGHRGHAPTSHPQGQPTVAPEVYILSSPEGPRALLVNGNGSMYYTPQPRQMPMMFPMPFPTPFPALAPLQPHPSHRPPMSGSWAHPPADNATNQAPHQPQIQPRAPAPQGPQPVQLQVQPGLVVGQQVHHVGNQQVNVQVRVRAIALGQIWQHVWMVLRLLLFIWWFTSPTASWWRWFTIISLAVALFIINTGLLNPVAEQMWVPVRRHLQNLMPLADGHGREQPAARGENAQGPAADNGANQGQQRMPEPAEIAARLVQERRHANANWLVTQARRLERAGILFLASIAPGVAERHIANLEAEARAERQRREAEAAAAEAARAAAENAQATENAEAEQGGTPSAVANSGPAGEERGDNARQEGVETRLIAT